MSKKKVTLAEAKELLRTDKIFFNGKSKFNFLDYGKYGSGITIEIPQNWTIDEIGTPQSPIKYISNKELTDGMNIDFDGKAEFLLGKYRLSQKGKPVFELTKPSEACDILISVDWGGAFNKTRGQNSDYAKEIGALYFNRRRSNGGGIGVDYWILPVDFVYDMDSRDVSKILADIEKDEKDRELEIDKTIEKANLELKNSIENRDIILEQLEPIIKRIQEIDPGFDYTAETDKLTYKDSRYANIYTRFYTENLVIELSERLEKMQNEKEAKDSYTPMFEEMKATVKVLGLSLNFSDTRVSLSSSTSNYGYNSSYPYSQEGFNSFIQDLTNYQEKLAKEKEEARRKADELKKAAELKIKKDKAKEMGYPEVFEFWNRLGGATNLGHAYVIEKDGTIREPDYNNLRNNNHIYKYSDWKNDADGTQGYEQILPGEVIVTYTKEYTAVPYIFDIAWADGELTEAQLEVINDELEEKSYFADDIEGQEITDLKQWIINAVKNKTKECTKQLNINEEEKFAEEIVSLANEKLDAEDKAKQAENLKNEFENLTESKTVEDD